MADRVLFFDLSNENIYKGTSMEKKFVVRPEDAIKGTMQGGKGTFRIVIDEQTCGAHHFSLLINTLQRGTRTGSHQHEEESCLYILSGGCTVTLEDKSFRMEAQAAIFIPPRAMHQIDVYPEEDLTYIMIYAPPGPEQSLKSRGEYHFYSEQTSQ